jgi:hypothetical protein
MLVGDERLETGRGSHGGNERCGPSRLLQAEQISPALSRQAPGTGRDEAALRCLSKVPSSYDRGSSFQCSHSLDIQGNAQCLLLQGLRITVHLPFETKDCG